MSAGFRTVVLDLPPSPLGLLPGRSIVDHRCNECGEKVLTADLIGHARAHQSGPTDQGGEIPQTSFLPSSLPRVTAVQAQGMVTTCAPGIQVSDRLEDAKEAAEGEENVVDWVYGRHADGKRWVVVPREDAAYWSAIGAAIEAGSWDRLREVVGEEEYQDWVDQGCAPEEGGTFEDPEEVPGIGDGIFPPPVGLIMLGTIPEEVADAHCSYQETLLSDGEQLDIPDEAALHGIVADLEARGDVVVRDDELLGWMNFNY